MQRFQVVSDYTPSGDQPQAIAALAQEQIPKLKGCDAHFTVVLSDVDEKLYRRLGMHVSNEPKYERQRLYFK